MKKFVTTAIVVLSISLALILVGSILQGITWGTGFNGTAFANALNNIGYIAAMLSGVVLTGFGVATAVKGNSEEENKDNKDE